MDRTGDEFFSGSRLAGDEHGCVCGRHLRDFEKHVLDRVALADDLAELVVKLQFLLKRDVFSLQLVLQLMELCVCGL